MQRDLDTLASAIEAEAEAAAAAVRTRRRVDSLLAVCGVPAATELPAARLMTVVELAKGLGTSVTHVRRLDPPHVCVGDASTKRYDLAEVRAWLAEREPKATTPKPRMQNDAVDVTSSLRVAGLRAVAGGGR